MIVWNLTVAMATPVTAEVCGWYDIEFEDAHSTVGDDYLTDNTVDLPAHGARFRVTCTSCSPTITVYDDFLPWDEEDACAAMTLDTLKTYKIQLQSSASVQGNTINVWSDADKDTLYKHVVHGVSPSGPGVYDVTTNVADHWNIAAAAGFAHRRRAGAIADTNTVFDLINDECAGGGGCQTDDGIFLDATVRDNKYVIAHEFGHAFWDAVGGADNAGSSSADPGACFTYYPTGTAHEKNSKEFQSRAISEGWAHFYAALAFNVSNGGSGDCAFFTHIKSDWDLDGNTFNNSSILGCNYAPEPGVAWFSYLDAYCLGPGDDGANRANEWDWLRALWLVDEQFSFGQIVAIWANAGSDTWDTNGDDAWDCGTTACNDQPYARLRSVVETHALFDSYDLDLWDGAASVFGVDR